MEILHLVNVLTLFWQIDVKSAQISRLCLPGGDTISKNVKILIKIVWFSTEYD